jgi:UDP-2-acetamido-3-amino-2,3-dideoxy-glucuronate N-acetyltransferase
MRGVTARIHPSAIVEEGVSIGDGSFVWDNVHIRRNTRIGQSTIVGEKTHISYEVNIGNFVKINAFVYICTAVTIEDGVMLSAGCTFTNDLYPRAANDELTELRSSDPDEKTLSTVVREGATIGARAVIGPGITIGRFSMVGMGSVVTRSVPDFALVFGNPARLVGYVCRCGEPVMRFGSSSVPASQISSCRSCQRVFRLDQGVLTEVMGVAVAC